VEPAASTSAPTSRTVPPRARFNRPCHASLAPSPGERPARVPQVSMSVAPARSIPVNSHKPSRLLSVKIFHATPPLRHSRPGTHEKRATYPVVSCRRRCSRHLSPASAETHLTKNSVKMRLPIPSSLYNSRKQTTLRYSKYLHDSRGSCATTALATLPHKKPPWPPRFRLPAPGFLFF
jgi:hypothetical protein